jgi:hypothetical protein
MLLATATCGHPAEVEQRAPVTIGEFWSAFRKAVAAADLEGVAALTEFPFQTRGPSDSDPVVPRDRAAFLGLVGQMLETDSGMKAESETMRELIAKTAWVEEGWHRRSSQLAGGRTGGPNNSASAGAGVSFVDGHRQGRARRP